MVEGQIDRDQIQSQCYRCARYGALWRKDAGQRGARAIVVSFSNDRRLHFGLGNVRVAEVEIRWPMGSVEKFSSVAADQIVHITEGHGITHCEKCKTK